MNGKKIIVGVLIVAAVIAVDVMAYMGFTQGAGPLSFLKKEVPVEVVQGPEGLENPVCVTFYDNYKDGEGGQAFYIEKDSMFSEADLPKLTRDGYAFAGWYTVEDPKLNEEGYYEDEWYFQKKYMDYGGPTPAEGEVTEMPFTEDVNLYAHWEAPTEISSAQELMDMNKNLYGYYVLKNDIDLSDVEFTPVGVYEAEYEFTNPQWWVHGFRGTFDGQGHTITGLTFTDGKHGNALFASAGNATIKNVTLKDYSITGKGTQGIYTAPLLAFGLGSDLLIENCHTDGVIDVSVEALDSDVIYSGVTGLTAGCWGGQILNCSAKGKLYFDYHVTNGSEINIGGINGEGYTATRNCDVDMEIKGLVTSDATVVNGEDTHGDIYIGMVQGAATIVENCTAKGSIEVSYTKPSGETSVNVGGLVGQERYDSLKNNFVDVDITVKDGKKVYAGGVVGSYNTGVYGMIGAMSGISKNNIENCLVLTKIQLDSGVEREEVMVGNVVSALPEGNENPMLSMFLSKDDQPEYKVVKSVCLTSDEEKSDGDSDITFFATLDEMKGDALKEILGTGWTYKEGELPVPSAE